MRSRPVTNGIHKYSSNVKLLIKFLQDIRHLPEGTRRFLAGVLFFITAVGMFSLWTASVTSRLTPTPLTSLGQVSSPAAKTQVTPRQNLRHDTGQAPVVKRRASTTEQAQAGSPEYTPGPLSGIVESIKVLGDNFKSLSRALLK